MKFIRTIYFYFLPILAILFIAGEIWQQVSRGWAVDEALAAQRAYNQFLSRVGTLPIFDEDSEKPDGRLCFTWTTENNRVAHEELLLLNEVHKATSKAIGAELNAYTNLDVLRQLIVTLDEVNVKIDILQWALPQAAHIIDREFCLEPFPKQRT